ncbi:hypothetical protein Tco_1415956, partial [Tanacetum coccineum]
GNGQEDKSTRTDGEFFYDDDGINTAYETKYDVQSSEDAGTDDDDDIDEDFLVDDDNVIVELDVDVHLFGISMDLPFDNIGITNLVSDDVLEGEDVDVINTNGFDNDHGNDEARNYRNRRVYLLSIESRMNLKLYKNDSVRIRARCEGKVLVFTMPQGTGPIGPNRGMEAGPSGSSGPTTRRLIRISQLRPMSKAFRAKAKVKREIRGDHVLQYSMLRDYVVELQSTNPNTTIKIAVKRNTDLSLPTRVFQRIYVCLGALKLGFRARRRDLLGLDVFGDDIDLHPNSNFTFISNRQKGVIPAIKTVYLTASATNVKDFEKCMLELKTMNPKAHEWLNKILAEHWARSYFSGTAKSNLCSTTSVRSLMAGRLKKKRKRSKHEDEPFVKDGKLSRKGRTITCQSCENIRHNKPTCKGQGRKATTGGNNVEGSCSASRQAQQTEPAVGQDGSGAGAVIGLSAAAGEGGAGDPGGAGVASQVLKFQ